MRHPSDSQLALFAGGDLAVFDRWRIGRHVSRCNFCRHELEELKQAAEQLRDGASGMPPNLNWNRLAAEMTANIHLGLEAGECVAEQVAKPDRMGWRAAAVMAGLSCLLLTAWWLNPAPRRQPHGIRASRVEIRTTSSGIEVNENGHALTLLHSRGGQKPIIVSAPGTLRARFVDETGQVTVNNVYTD